MSQSDDHGQGRWPRPWRPPTLADVARRAGVSKATASRALAAGRTTARPAATGSVQRIARRLGYTTRRADLPRLLVLSSGLARTGYWATLSGVLEAAQEHGTDLSIHVLSASPARRREALLQALGTRVDAVVVLEFDSLGLAALHDLPEGLPLAVAGGYPQPDDGGLKRAWTDDHAGAVMACEHLLGLGHTRVAYVGVPSAGHPDPRLAGWREVMAGAGLEAPEPVATGWGTTTGERAAAALTRSGATAVLCGNDDLAIGLLAGLARAGVRIPDDISVVGVDDHPHASATTPPLTTVRLDFARVGQEAVALALGTRREERVEVPVELVERESVGRPLPDPNRSLSPSRPVERQCGLARPAP